MARYISKQKRGLTTLLMAALIFAALAYGYTWWNKKQSNGTLPVEPAPGTGMASSITDMSENDRNGLTDGTDSREAVPEAKRNIPEYEVFDGKIICIDAGHQAKGNYEKEPIAPSSNVMKGKMSAGTAGIATGTPEYKVNLAVSLKLKDVLETHGAKVIMTRETDDVDIGNIQRAQIANLNGADISVRIHADGSDNRQMKGILVLYPGDKYVNDGQLRMKSRIAAQKVLDGMVAATGAISRGIMARDDLTGFNWSTVPVILVEMGMMTNEEEDRLLNTPEYQDKIVKGIMDGLADYFSVIKD